MTRVLIVSANHVVEKYRLDNVRFGVNTYAETGRIGFRPAGASNNWNEEYWAQLAHFGCGKTFNKVEKAIIHLLSDNGCTNIRITEIEA